MENSSSLLALQSHFAVYKDILQFGMAVLMAAIAIGGWFFNSWRARVLQRKQLAINLLHDNRFEQRWMDSLFSIGRLTVNQPNFMWGDFAERVNARNEEVSEDDQKIHDDLRCVLNNLEAIAIAIFNKAIDEDIIRWSYDFYYQHYNNKLNGYIVKIREIKNDEELYINFTEISKKWKKDPQPARPSGFWYNLLN